MEKQIIAGRGLAFHESGNGETVVLLHGFCGSSSYWEKIVPILNKQNRIITVDLRGHGSSCLPDGSFKIEDMAQDIADFLVLRGIENVFLFGHSLGGYVTLAFAETHPRMLKGFGLIHSTAFPDSDEGKEGRINAIETIQTEGITPFVNQLVPKLFSDEALQQMEDTVEDVKKIGYHTKPQAAIETLKAMRGRKDRNDVLETTHLPVLLVAGKNDKVISPDKTFSVTGENIQQVVIESAGHMSMYEAPETLSESIQQFLSGVR